jgi:hypothetical protein
LPVCAMVRTKLTAAGLVTSPSWVVSCGQGFAEHRVVLGSIGPPNKDPQTCMFWRFFCTAQVGRKALYAIERSSSTQVPNFLEAAAIVQHQLERHGVASYLHSEFTEQLKYLNQHLRQPDAELHTTDDDGDAELTDEVLATDDELAGEVKMGCELEDSESSDGIWSLGDHVEDVTSDSESTEDDDITSDSTESIEDEDNIGVQDEPDAEPKSCNIVVQDEAQAEEEQEHGSMIEDDAVHRIIRIGSFGFNGVVMLFGCPTHNPTNPTKLSRT